MKQTERVSSLATMFADFKVILKKAKAAPPLAPSPAGLAKLRKFLLPYAPAPLFEWLALHDGFQLPDAIGGCFFGTRNHAKEEIGGVEYIRKMYGDWPRHDLIPFAVDMSHQYFCIVASEIDEDSGIMPIGYVDAVRLDRVEYYVSSNFELFVRALLDASKGKKFEWYLDKKSMLARDPRLKDLERPQLPWTWKPPH